MACRLQTRHHIKDQIAQNLLEEGVDGRYWSLLAVTICCVAWVDTLQYAYQESEFSSGQLRFCEGFVLTRSVKYNPLSLPEQGVFCLARNDQIWSGQK